MKPTDRLLQRWRIGQALRWIPAGAAVLDIGCGDGGLFAGSRGRISSGVGIEPVQPEAWHGPSWSRLIVGTFPDDAPDEVFDAIVMLAVVEHVEEPELVRWATQCHQLLKPGGRVVITVPAPAVDHLLHVGMALRLLDGMEVHQHHGFDPRRVPTLFAQAGLELEAHRRFQLGLNNLFVLRRPEA
jgi:SAM-dependent methyltransferase